HTRAHAHTHTHTRARARARTHTHPPTHTHIEAYTHTQRGTHRAANSVILSQLYIFKSSTSIPIGCVCVDVHIKVGCINKCVQVSGLVYIYSVCECERKSVCVCVCVQHMCVCGDEFVI